MKLKNAITSRFPDGLDYSDAVQLCAWIHLRKNTLPSDEGEFAGKVTEIARVFAALAQTNLIRVEDNLGVNFHDIMDVKHWVHVIESFYHSNSGLDFDFPQRYKEIFPTSSKPKSGNGLTAC